LLEILKDSKIRFLILNYDNLAAKSRYAQISLSPMVREMLMVVSEESCDASLGRTKLEDRIRKMGLEKRHPDYEPFRGKAYQSTFYDTVSWLEENKIISIIPKRRPKGKGFKNAYCLEGNVILFKNVNNDWIPSVLFVCPEKLFMIEGSEATEQNVVNLLPNESICNFCKRKNDCDINNSIQRLDVLRKDRFNPGG